LPADGPDSRRGCRRRWRDPVRSDLPGAGDLADGRGSRLAAAVAHDRSGSVLHGGRARGGCRAEHAFHGGVALMNGEPGDHAWSCPPRDILVAVDFGAASAHAAAVAGLLASAFK